MDDEPFALRNDPPKCLPAEFAASELQRQQGLFDGLDCLPGQQDLFDDEVTTCTLETPMTEDVKPTAAPDTAPTIASPDDIDREFANRAFYGTSFSPEQRGQSRREDYANGVNGLYAELWPLAKTAEQKELLASEMERYRQGFLKHMNAYLASHSNVVSSMIAGPSKFPAARMQKRGDWADNKLRELLDWDKRAQAAIKAKLLDARPEEEKAAQEWRRLARDIQGSLNVIATIDAGNSPYTRSAFVNSIAGKVERLAKNGETELVSKALQLVRDYNASHKKPAISERHKFWTYGEGAQQQAVKAEAAASAETEIIGQAEGVEIIVNPQADRVQIVFDAKPDRETIGKLKAEAWNWAPSEGAWQRKLTEAAKYSAKGIVGIHATVQS